MTARAGGRVAFVLKGYPRLSETFIAQEILALEERDEKSLTGLAEELGHRATADVAGSIARAASSRST